MSIGKGSIVTLDINKMASNVFFVDKVEGDGQILLSHPLAPSVLIRASESQVNHVGATIKDSVERCLDYAHANKTFLDYNTISDLESIGIFFVLKRRLTPRQKQILANVCGVIASVKFNNDLRMAMNFIAKNSSVLDEFNLMWYNNFKGLFHGHQPVTSKKQRSAIFNIAGHALAELENPTAPKQR